MITPKAIGEYLCVLLWIMLDFGKIITSTAQYFGVVFEL
jgi:hypothetical protein